MALKTDDRTEKGTGFPAANPASSTTRYFLCGTEEALLVFFVDATFFFASVTLLSSLSLSYSSSSSSLSSSLSGSSLTGSSLGGSSFGISLGGSSARTSDLIYFLANYTNNAD